MTETVQLTVGLSVSEQQHFAIVKVMLINGNKKKYG